jgi:hypothetical protein
VIRLAQGVHEAQAILLATNPPDISHDDNGDSDSEEEDVAEGEDGDQDGDDEGAGSDQNGDDEDADDDENGDDEALSGRVLARACQKNGNSSECAHSMRVQTATVKVGGASAFCASATDDSQPAGVVLTKFSVQYLEASRALGASLGVAPPLT